MKEIFILFILTCTINADDDIKINYVKRVINLKTQLITITNDLEIVNNGIVSEAKITWWPDRFGNLSYITAEQNENTLGNNFLY